MPGRRGKNVAKCLVNIILAGLVSCSTIVLDWW